jgi:hypothetical protein
MQKAYSLQPDEVRQAKQLEDEQRQLLAQYGSLELQRKAIKKRLPQIEEQQRGIVRNAIGRIGVTQFSAARIDGTNLLVEVPDETPAAAPVASEHVNGAAANTQ